MKKILVISPSNKGTIASCTANIIKALLNTSNVEVFPVVLYKEDNGITVFEKCKYIVDRTIIQNKNGSSAFPVGRVVSHPCLSPFSQVL